MPTKPAGYFSQYNQQNKHKQFNIFILTADTLTAIITFMEFPMSLPQVNNTFNSLYRIFLFMQVFLFSSCVNREEISISFGKLGTQLLNRNSAK